MNLVAPRRKSLSISTRRGGKVGDQIGEVEEPLSPVARMFQQPNVNCHVIVVMGVGRKIDVEEFKAGVESTIACHPRFSSILVSDGHKLPVWVRAKVVMDYHMVVPNMDCTGINPDKLVEDYLSSLSTSAMDSSRPLWDIHLLNIRTSIAEAVAVLRVHHSLGDGISLISLLLASSRKVSDPECLPTVPVMRSQVRYHDQPLGNHSRLTTLLLRLWGLVVSLWYTMVDALLYTSTAAFSQDTKTLLKGTKGVEFRKKRFVHRTVSLDDVKAIKNRMDCTVNDVLLGVTSAGLSCYLSKKVGDGNGDEKMDLLANISIKATLMVNLRQSPGLHTMPEMMKGENNGARWGNCFGFSVLPLTISNCKDPLEYIRECKATATRKKNSLQALFGYNAILYITRWFGIKLATTLLDRVLRHTTVCFSSIYGPVEEIQLYGHPLIYLAPTIYGHPQALTLHFQSYMNKLTIVAAVDELNIPDPHMLLDELVESLRLIKDVSTAHAKPSQL